MAIAAYRRHLPGGAGHHPLPLTDDRRRPVQGFVVAGAEGALGGSAVDPDRVEARLVVAHEHVADHLAAAVGAWLGGDLLEGFLDGERWEEPARRAVAGCVACEEEFGHR